MKTLYVSDLDGTLLRSDETLSPFTVDTINTLVQRGCLFSYATARSYITASKVTNQLSAPLPLIVYNGAMIIHNADGRRLKLNPFPETVKTLLEDLLSHGIYPIVYSLQGDRERYSFLPDKCTRGMEIFLKTREGDPAARRFLLLRSFFAASCSTSPVLMSPPDCFPCIGNTGRSIALFMKRIFTPASNGWSLCQRKPQRPMQFGS